MTSVDLLNDDSRENVATSRARRQVGGLLGAVGDGLTRLSQRIDPEPEEHPRVVQIVEGQPPSDAAWVRWAEECSLPEEADLMRHAVRYGEEHGEFDGPYV